MTNNLLLFNRIKFTINKAHPAIIKSALYV